MSAREHYLGGAERRQGKEPNDIIVLQTQKIKKYKK